MAGGSQGDWTEGFFLVWPLGSGPGPEARLCAIEVRGWRERRAEEFAGDPGNLLREMRDFTGGQPAWMLASEPSAVGGKILEASPPEWRWLWGRELTALLFPADPEPRGGPIERMGKDGGDGGTEGARAYLGLLRSWHLRARGIREDLREQVAALLHACGSPWAFFFSSSPGKVRPLAFAEAASPARSPQKSTGKGVGIEIPPAAGELTPQMLGEALDAVLRGGGFPGGQEERPQQLRMAQEVAEAMIQGTFLAIEAGTGVGKSLAYLLPASLLALSGQLKVVISTHTKGLQDQLSRRDLPLLAEAMPGLRFSLLKGRSNYICLRRWEEWCRYAFEDSYGGRRLLLDRERDMFLAWAWILLFLQATESGDLEELPLEATERLREHLDGFRSLAEECPGPACPHRERCFVEAARHRAAESHLVVVNHALLLADSSQAASGEGERAVLPPFEHLVVDEAHNLEAVATEAFARRLSLGDCRALAERAGGRRGLLPRCEAFLAEADGGEGGNASRGALAAARQAGEELGRVQSAWRRFFTESLPEVPLPPSRGWREREESADTVGGGAGRDAGSGGSRRDAGARVTREVEGSPAWKILAEEGERLAQGFESLAATLESLAGRLEKVEGTSPGAEAEGKALTAWASRLSRLCGDHAETLRSFFREADEGEEPGDIRWRELTFIRDRGGEAVAHAAVCSAPAQIGTLLAEAVLSPLRSAVFTSATLRTGGGEEGFSYFSASVGLEEAARQGREVRFSCLGSPFDYSRQARCLLVKDLSEPGGDPSSNSRYLEGVVEVLEEALLASRGRGLVLFTSYDMLERAAGRLFPKLERQGIPCLRQEKGSGNLRLLERFREEVDSVLFATASFWEGVDVPGESLSLLAITRLPFPYPGDPLVEGRQEFLEARGRSGWRNFYLPCAVMRFRQGLGRLIRRRDDRGIVLVLDPRLCGRAYARPFLESLPDGLEPLMVKACEVGERVREFFLSE